VVVCYLSLKGAFFPLWFLIGFAGFHAFIYFFIWFFCSAQFFFFFGVLCSVGFMPFFFFFFFLTLKLKLCFSCTTGTQSGTGTPLFCLALNTKPFRIVLAIPSENIFRPEYSVIHSSYFFYFYFKVATKIPKQKFTDDVKGEN
jgi:hypothetical protein